MSETPSPSPSTSLTFEEVRVFRYYFPRLILLRGNCSGDLGGGGGGTGAGLLCSVFSGREGGGGGSGCAPVPELRILVAPGNSSRFGLLEFGARFDSMS